MTVIFFRKSRQLTSNTNSNNLGEFISEAFLEPSRTFMMGRFWDFSR